MRLLKLPAEVQLGLRQRQISMGHARAIINVENGKKQIEIFEEIIKNDLSVRKVEELVRDLNKTPEEKVKQKKETHSVEGYDTLKQQLSNFFQTNIQFSRTDSGTGKIVIPFTSDEELEKIITILDKANS